MVRCSLLILSLLSFSAHAGEGMVSVLEAPLFKSPSRDSKIMQYARKGDRVYIHPVVLIDRKAYGDLPAGVSLGTKNPEDPFSLTEDIENFHDGSDFVLTKDNQGRDAWMLREHVHIWYADAREKHQRTVTPDNTDYRLLEPLPKGYPLARLKKVRGDFQFSIGSPLTSSYTYNERVKAEGYSNQFEFNGQLLKVRESDLSGRWYTGAILTIRTASNDFELQTRRAREDWVRLGGGISLSYDPWRSDKARITVKSMGLLYPFTQASLTQQEFATGVKETRSYFGWNTGARLEAQYVRIQLVGDLDFIAGVWGEVESPIELQAKTATNRPQWWGRGDNDKFNTSISYTFAGMIGLHSAY